MFPSELRWDIISQGWVIIATGRARRPETFKKEKHKKDVVSKKDCVFCNISTQERPSLIFYKGMKVPFEAKQKLPKNFSKWTTIAFPNKYPAVMPYSSLKQQKEGDFYRSMNAIGFHEVVVTKHHKKHIANFSIQETKELLDVYQERYNALMKEKFVNYISIFHNHGSEAGASIAHPHSQIITTPLVDNDLRKALSNSEDYFKREKKCVYCAMIEWDRKKKERIVFENKDFLVICPFASKSAFQVIISPKKHLSYFEKITEEEKFHLAEAFQIALKKLCKGLNNPAYNFYLHTAPCDGESHNHYHWHWTILPKTSIWAGFEIGTGMEISTIQPEKAAAYLRKQ